MGAGSFGGTATGIDDLTKEKVTYWSNPKLDRMPGYLKNGPQDGFIPLSSFSPVTIGGKKYQRLIEAKGLDASTPEGKALIAEDRARLAKDKDLQSGKALSIEQTKNTQKDTRKSKKGTAGASVGGTSTAAEGTILTGSNSSGTLLGGGSDILKTLLGG